MTRFLALLAFLATPALAEGNPDHGRALYRLNCATCHGLEARGDGPMTQLMTISPPDLTLIADGEPFPMADVVRRIDGRDMILSHGGPMPIFGFILEHRDAVIEDETGTPIFTSQQVLDIAAYLGTIQQ